MIELAPMTQVEFPAFFEYAVQGLRRGTRQGGQLWVRGQPCRVVCHRLPAALQDAMLPCHRCTNLRVEADRLIITDQPTKTVKGLVLAQAPPFIDYRYGDRARAEGKLQTPTDTGDFSYREYLARQDVYSTPHLRWARVSCRARA